MSRLADYPMVEAHFWNLQEENRCRATAAWTIERIKTEFDLQGPFHYCKKYDMLVNNSGEEFAIQWMSFYNGYVGFSVY